MASWFETPRSARLLTTRGKKFLVLRSIAERDVSLEG
jgi:hypothetical protein